MGGDGCVQQGINLTPSYRLGHLQSYVTLDLLPSWHKILHALWWCREERRVATQKTYICSASFYPSLISTSCILVRQNDSDINQMYACCMLRRYQWVKKIHPLESSVVSLWVTSPVNMSFQDFAELCRDSSVECFVTSLGTAASVNFIISFPPQRTALPTQRSYAKNFLRRTSSVFQMLKDYKPKPPTTMDSSG